MENKEVLKVSTNAGDIDKAMKIVATFGGNEDDLKRIKVYIEKEFRELGDNRILYFLEKDSEIVGMVQLILKNADGDSDLANGKDIAHVHALQIPKNQHRKGHAYRLMLLLEEEAKNQGLKELTLGVDASNEKAQGLYKKLGYSLLRITEGRSPDEKLFYLHKILVAELSL